MQTTTFVKDANSVVDRLNELKLTRDGLLRVVDTAIAGSANVTSNHANNAAGTYRYHEGTASLRDEFAGESGWIKDSNSNIEAIFNPEIGIKVVFQNVDRAGFELHLPQPNSPKKSASKRCIHTNSLFDAAAIPLTYNQRENAHIKTYYLMVSENNECVDAELSLVTDVTNAGLFNGMSERIYLNYPEWASFSPPVEHTEGSGEDFSFEISRK